MKVQYLWCRTLSSVSVCRQGYPSTPILPLGPSPHRPLGMTTGVLPRRKNFPTHGPWDRDGSVPGHRKWSGCKKNPGNNGMQGVRKGVQVGVEPGWGLGWPEWVCMYAQKLENEEWVWWAHRKYPTHRKSGASRAGL